MQPQANILIILLLQYETEVKRKELIFPGIPSRLICLHEAIILDGAICCCLYLLNVSAHSCQTQSNVKAAETCPCPWFTYWWRAKGSLASWPVASIQGDFIFDNLNTIEDTKFVWIMNDFILESHNSMQGSH